MGYCPAGTILGIAMATLKLLERTLLLPQPGSAGLEAFAFFLWIHIPHLCSWIEGSKREHVSRSMEASCQSHMSLHQPGKAAGLPGPPEVLSIQQEKGSYQPVSLVTKLC